MTYTSNGKHYSFSYKEVIADYKRFSSMTDERFLANLPDILHFAVYTSYIKELSIENTIADEGIIHQLIHLLAFPNEPLLDLGEIRKQFNELLRFC